MTKRRRKKNKHSVAGETVPGRNQNWDSRALKVGTIALIVLLAVAGWLTFADRSSTSGTDTTTILGQVETFPCESREHVPPDTRISYSTDPPVCGPHYSRPVAPGFYTAEQVPEALVHSLEHGNVVIYYEQPGAKTLQTLQAWASRYTGAWDGVVVVLRPNLDTRVILTAWGKKLELETFDADAATVFVDVYRGRGPEKQIRVR